MINGERMSGRSCSGERKYPRWVNVEGECPRELSWQKQAYRTRSTGQFLILKGGSCATVSFPIDSHLIRDGSSIAYFFYQNWLPLLVPLGLRRRITLPKRSHGKTTNRSPTFHQRVTSGNLLPLTFRPFRDNMSDISMHLCLPGTDVICLWRHLSLTPFLFPVQTPTGSKMYLPSRADEDATAK